MKQARQFIVHGFIAVNGRRITIPSYMITTEEEKAISYYQGIKPKILDIDLKKPELHKEENIENNSVAQEEAKEESTEVKVESKWGARYESCYSTYLFNIS